jgi:arginyl-tRNA synthetase
MKEQLTRHIDDALRSLLQEADDRGELPEITLEVPRQSDHGDFSCNVAMPLAKRLRKAPRAIAEDLVARLGDAGGLLDSADVAGPGFVNFRLKPTSWQRLVCEIVEVGDNFGATDVGGGQRVQVEYVSANPTGPLSTGHGRQAVLGDCIARLLQKSGYDVTREYYFNDGGRQMRVLGDSVKARYLEALGRAAPPTSVMLTDGNLSACSSK